MKKIYSFIFIFVFGFFINLLLQNDSEAIVCVTNADGAIQLTANGVAGTQEKNDGELAPFQYPNGIIDDEFNSNFADQCNAEPLFYKMKVYKVALCTQDPYVASGLGNPRFESCIDVLNNPSGKIVTIEKGVDGNDLLDGAELVIPTGEYPYFLIILSNHLHVKHKQDYVNNDGTTGAKMWGNGDSTDAQRKTCYTTAVVTTITGEWAGDATFQNAHLDLDGNAVTVVDSGQDGNARLKCVNDNSETDYDYATEIIETFGEANGNWNSNDVVARWPYAASSVGGGNKAAILLQSDLETVATNMENGVVLLYAVSLTNPLIITENTTQFNIGFGLSGSVSVDFTTLDGSDEFLLISKHGADPVDILFTAN